MLMRAIGAAALALSLTSGALAGSQQGILHRVSCTVVRYYVAQFSASAAESWARGHGATEAEIDAARRCLKDAPDQTAQAARWSVR
jgi:hypothetical protein